MFSVFPIFLVAWHCWLFLFLCLWPYGRQPLERESLEREGEKERTEEHCTTVCQVKCVNRCIDHEVGRAESSKDKGVRFFEGHKWSSFSTKQENLMALSSFIVRISNDTVSLIFQCMTHVQPNTFYQFSWWGSNLMKNERASSFLRCNVVVPLNISHYRCNSYLIPNKCIDTNGSTQTLPELVWKTWSINSMS